MHYKNDVSDARTKSIHNPIKKNKLPLFKIQRPKKSVQSKQLAYLRNDVALFGRLYIANQLREGDPSVFFCHENQLYPPSLSSQGNLRPVKKADLVKCLHVPSLTEQAEEFDCKVFDGAVLVHILNPKAAVTFQNYADNVFLPFLSRELERVRRIDVVWDRYFPYSIKGSAREKRGAGVRQKVSSNTKIPGRWLDFLRDSRNKI